MWQTMWKQCHSTCDDIVIYNSFPWCKHVQNIRERELKIKSLFTKKEKIFETCQITNIQIQEFTKWLEFRRVLFRSVITCWVTLLSHGLSHVVLSVTSVTLTSWLYNAYVTYSIMYSIGALSNICSLSLCLRTIPSAQLHYYFHQVMSLELTYFVSISIFSLYSTP